MAFAEASPRLRCDGLAAGTTYEATEGMSAMVNAIHLLQTKADCFKRQGRVIGNGRTEIEDDWLESALLFTRPAPPLNQTIHGLVWYRRSNPPW
jgi:hypothetical protein